MGLTRLSSLLPPPDYLYLIENLVYKENRIQLDGYRFRNCAFVGCILHTTTGNFAIEECFFQGNWWVHFDGNAARIVKLTSILQREPPNPNLLPVIHPNGGVTIT